MRSAAGFTISSDTTARCRMPRPEPQRVLFAIRSRSIAGRETRFSQPRQHSLRPLPEPGAPPIRHSARLLSGAQTLLRLPRIRPARGEALVMAHDELGLVWFTVSMATPPRSTTGSTEVEIHAQAVSSQRGKVASINFRFRQPLKLDSEIMICGSNDRIAR